MTRTDARTSSTLITTAICLFVAAPAVADATNTARVIISPGASGGTGPLDNTDSHPGTCDASGTATGGFGATGSGTAHTEYGLIQLTGTASGPLVTSSRGIVRDTLTLTAPGVPTGTPGTITYSVRVSGHLIATGGTSGATWMLQADVGGGAFDISRSGTYYAPELTNPGYQGDALGVYTVTVPTQFGHAKVLDLELTVSANSANSGLSTGHADFGGPFTLNWLGITNVTANNVPVTTFTVTSESGTNWAGDLTPSACDTIDFNGDGLFPDTQDIDDFLSVFSGGACSTGVCGDIDFNNDGLFPDTSDIDSLLSVFSGGPCL